MKSETEETLTLSKEEYQLLIEKIEKYSNMQRITSLILWIGIFMIFVHLIVDIIFHT